MDLGDKLKILEQQERNYRNRLRKSVSKVDDAQIRIRRRGDKLHFFKWLNGKELSLNGKQAEIIDIVLAQCDRKRIILSEYNSSVLAKAIAQLKDCSFDRSNYVLQQNGSPIPLYHLDDWKWMKSEYERNPYKTEELKYTTQGGIKVRSKSERFIADRLEFWVIPYRTELRIDVGHMSMYPDFVIRRADGTLVIWEHFGLMNDPEYRKRALEKIELYRKAGYVQHKNLICTWEEDIASADDIDNIIRRFILM